MEPTKHSSKTDAAEERPRHPGSVAPAAGAGPVLHRALAAAGMVAWEWSLAEGRITPAGALTLWGVEGGSGDDDLLAAVHPDDRAAVRRARDLAAAGEEGGGYRCEYRVVGPDGRARWIESRGRVERGPDGRARSIVGVSLDVTDRKRAEAALGESESRYRAVVEGQTEFILRLRPDGTLTFVNDAYCRYRARSREDPARRLRRCRPLPAGPAGHDPGRPGRALARAAERRLRARGPGCRRPGASRGVGRHRDLRRRRAAGRDPGGRPRGHRPTAGGSGAPGERGAAPGGGGEPPLRPAGLRRRGEVRAPELRLPGALGRPGGPAARGGRAAARAARRVARAQPARPGRRDRPGRGRLRRPGRSGSRRRSPRSAPAAG